ncbi:MAG: hypothetical protein ACFCUI_11145 [Bernardetiaceae bacterium]
MMNQKNLYSLFLFVLLFFGGICTIQAQDWGDEPLKAQEAYARLVDYVKAEQYEQAHPDAGWLMQHAPRLAMDMYVKAIKVYEEMEGLAAKNKDKAAQEGYQDTVLLLYKQRLEYGFHSGEDDIYRRAGYKAYPYLVTRKGAEDTLYQFYGKVIETNQNNTPRAQLTYFVDVSGRMWTRKKISKAEFFAAHEKAQTIALANVADAEAKGDTQEATIWKEKCADKLDDILTAYLKDELDCQTVKDLFVSKAKENPDDQAAFDKAFAWMIKAGCVKDEEFLTLLEQKYEKDQDCGSGKTLAKLYMAAEDYATAEQWYQKIFDGPCQDQPEEKAKAYLQLAKIKTIAGEFSTARNYARQAAAADKSVAADAYTLIGDMYASSFKMCGEEVKGDPIKVRAVFLAAYDMYAQAGNSEKMNKIKGQFPSTEEVFTQNKKVGESVPVGCWIQTTTTLRTR